MNEETLNKAIETMNEGDIFECSDGDIMIVNSIGTLVVKDSNIMVHMSKENALREGKVIPAEPKVLTAEELIEKHTCIGEISALNRRAILNISINELLKIGLDFHQNGRLERDLELRNVISLIKKYLNGMANLYNAETMEVLHGDLIEAVYKNLKPLNKP